MVNNIYFKNLMIFEISEQFEYECKEIGEYTDREKSRVTLYQVNPRVFFSVEFMRKLVSHLQMYKGSNVILIYQGFSLKMIKTAFKVIGIQISGGNNILKHIISPQQFLLSKIITMFYGSNIDLITESFLEISSNKNLSRVVHDFTSEKDLLLLQELKNDAIFEPAEYKRLFNNPVEISKTIKFNYTKK